MQQANPQTTTTTAKSPQSQTFTETITSPEIESTFKNINERLDQYEKGLNEFRGFLQTVDTDVFAGDNRLLKRIHRLEDIRIHITPRYE